jgi:hypothetical protein
VASLLRDFNCAREGGRAASSLFGATVAASECDAAAIPAVTPLTFRNRRREIMNPSPEEQCNQAIIGASKDQTGEMRTGKKQTEMRNYSQVGCFAEVK